MKRSIKLHSVTGLCVLLAMAANAQDAVVAMETTDYTGAFGMGFGFGLTIWGFGWVYNMVFRGIKASVGGNC